MSENYWLSRRPKYTVEQTFQMGLQYLLAYARKDAMLLFKDAALHGHQEAKFLYDGLSNHPLNPNGGINLLKWSTELYNAGQEPRALRYMIWFSRNQIRAALQLNQHQKTALNDDPLYQFIIGSYYEYDKGKNDEAIAWYRKSSTADFGPAFYRVARMLAISQGTTSEIQKEVQKLCCHGCEIGEHTCFELMNTKKEWFQVDPLMMLKYEIRDFMIWRLAGSRPVLISGIIQNQMDTINSGSVNSYAALSTVFMAGQEFDDYDRYFIKMRDREHLITQHCVAVYRQMTSSARQAAIQSILILRSLRVCRDIAILIAKSVYASRTESDWYSPGS